MPTGADSVVRALEDEDVPFVFGIPGTHTIELYDALAQSSSVKPVLVTDEQSASFMADGVWRASGRLGCCALVPGAGLTHALSGIAEALLDTIPVLVLGCGVRRDTGMAFQLHDIDQMALARPVTKSVMRPEHGADLYRTIREACRIARAGVPGPVFVEVPAELYLLTHEDDTAPLLSLGTPPPQPPLELVERAAALLTHARRPMLYLGFGARGADVVALAETLEAPVATTVHGKGVFPESHPLALWPGFGDAAPPFARAVARECDATLAIGCRFGEVATGSYGAQPRRPLIHVDIGHTALERNVDTDLAIVSDARAFVDALLGRLTHRPIDVVMRAAIRDGHAAVEREWRETASPTGVTPHTLIDGVQRRFGPATLYTADSGNGTFLAMECLRLERAGHFLAPVDYACMGYSVPAAIGAKLARPETPCVALTGDGAFLMTGLELLTAAHLEVAVAVIVLRDHELAQIAQFQSLALGRKSASELPNYGLEQLCAGMGVQYLRLDRDVEIADVLDQAAGITERGGPVVVDVAIDYSHKTYFTRGVVKTNFGRLPWADRLRFVLRALGRRVSAARRPQPVR